jgi:O-antigen/teichoic acid export membrane protein
VSARPTARSLAVEILASWSRHLAGIVSGIATLALIAHRLGPSALGAWAILGSTSFFLGLSDLGLSTAVSRAVAAGDRPRARRALGLALFSIAALSPALAALSIVGTVDICASADGRGLGHAAIVVLIVVAGGVTSAVAAPYRAFAIMSGGLRGLARARAIGASAQVSGVAVGLTLTPGLLAPALALLTGALVETLLVVATARAIDGELPRSPARPESPREFLGWLREGLPTLALNAAVILSIRVDVLILARVAPLAAVAAYGVASRAVDQCFLLAKQVSVALQSRLGAKETRRHAVELATPILSALVVSGLLALCLDGRALLGAWAGAVVEERTFAVALDLLALGACLSSLSEIACSTLTLGAPSAWRGATPIIFGAVVNLVVSIGGAPLLGAWSVAGGTVVGNALTCGMSWRWALPLLGFSRRDLARSLLPGAASGLAAASAGALLRGAAGGGAVASLVCTSAATLTGLAAAALTLTLSRRACAVGEATPLSVEHAGT